MEVRVGIEGSVLQISTGSGGPANDQGTHVVDDNVDSLDVDTSSKDIGRDEDSLLKRLELLESVDTKVSGMSTMPNSPLGLRESRVDADGREVALLQQSVQLGRSGDRLNEDADLCIRHCSTRGARCVPG